MKMPLTMLALVAFSTAALAQDGAARTQGQPPVEHYTYATHLDVAKVISEDPIPNVCGIAPVHMTYLDSKGKRHVLEYEVAGNGCDNG